MPTYNLQYGPGQSPAGQLQITGNTASTAVFQCRPNVTSAWRTINRPTYTAKAGGNGNPQSPADGDTLSLGSNPVNGQTFDGAATYSSTRTPPGYYTGSGITGGQADWDAADSGPLPTGTKS
jgi:hypothetical protein